MKSREINSLFKNLSKVIKNPKTDLAYKNKFTLLVSVVLSAQCTDVNVNNVTKNIYPKYNKPEHFVKLGRKRIEVLIKKINFFRNKAKSVYLLSKQLIERHNSEVPKNFEKLIALPGVGRKTANVVMGNVYSIPSVVVDTHVTRITNLLKFVKTRDAKIIEQILMKIITQNDWTLFAHLLIDHGRMVCIANRPNCGECVISEFCPSNKGDH